MFLQVDTVSGRTYFAAQGEANKLILYNNIYSDYAFFMASFSYKDIFMFSSAHLLLILWHIILSFLSGYPERTEFCQQDYQRLQHQWSFWSHTGIN